MAPQSLWIFPLCSLGYHPHVRGSAEPDADVLSVVQVSDEIRVGPSTPWPGPKPGAFAASLIALYSVTPSFISPNARIGGSTVPHTALNCHGQSRTILVASSSLDSMCYL